MGIKEYLQDFGKGFVSFVAGVEVEGRTTPEGGMPLNMKTIDMHDSMENQFAERMSCMVTAKMASCMAVSPPF